MELNFISIISIIAIFQSVLLSFFFFINKKGSRLSNKIFGSLLGAYALYITINFLKKSTAGNYFLNVQYPILYLAGEVILIVGPLLYFYIRATRDPSFQFKKQHLFHLVPFLLSDIIIGLNIYNTYPNFQWLPICLFYRPLLPILQLLVYIIACKFSLGLSIHSFFSKIEDIQLSRLRFLLLAFFVLWINLVIIYVIRHIVQAREYDLYSSIFYFINMFIFINCVAFIAWKEPDTFLFIKKYKKSELKESDKEFYRTSLLEAMEKEKLYLDPSLTLPSLAKRLSIPVTHLSQIINESFNLNFYDFINRYRIDECCRQLKNHPKKNTTILEIAYSVGFNSKSTFNEAFKKYTGITPTEFIQRSS